jgi:alkylation response protein AidB-like acyl-CoA dehydrogenase
MQYGLTREQMDIQKAAREFAEGELRAVARDLDARETFDDRLWKKAAELGFLAVFVDEKYGGLGMGYLEQCLIVEEFARVDLGIAHALESAFFGSQLIQLAGTEEQKERYLPSLCRGEMRMGVAITEPDAGSDVTAVSTEAIKEKDEFIINGNKIFITNATLADFMIVLCVTNSDHPKKHERFSTILVETNRPGYEANALHGKLSIRPSNTGEVAFKGVRVPLDNLLGKEGRGFYNIMEFFNRTDKKFKDASYKYEKVGEYWNAAEVKMTDYEKNHSTKILLNDVKFDQGLSDELFLVEKLKPADKKKESN